MLELGNHLRRNCQYHHATGEERRHSAHIFLSEIASLRQHGTEELCHRFGVPLPSDGDVDGDHMMQQMIPMEQAFLIADWRANCAYIACETTTSFIHDQGASIFLRQASMKSACELLKVVSVFAFRAIIVTLINVDPLGSRTATLLNVAISDSSSASPPPPHFMQQLYGTPVNSHTTDFDDDDDATPLSLLTTNGMKCIEEMVRQDCLIAKQVLKLVEETVQRHAILQSAFVWHGHAASQPPLPGSSDVALPDSDQQRHTSIHGSDLGYPPNWNEDERHSTMFDQLVEAFVGQTPAENDEPFQSTQVDLDLTRFLEEYLRGNG
ncbi:hypothetical protein CBS101457_006891 [Exobasidium rhododendri]|nr:hypothetical protein CBS101457_006891 [Exobasidium rhododendri]